MKTQNYSKFLSNNYSVTGYNCVKFIHKSLLNFKKKKKNQIMLFIKRGKYSVDKKINKIKQNKKTKLNK